MEDPQVRNVPLSAEFRCHLCYPGGQLPPGLVNFLGGHPLNLELVSRPEGKQLLVGLETGSISVDHLVQQVSNPALQVASSNSCTASPGLFTDLFTMHSIFVVNSRNIISFQQKLHCIYSGSFY